MMKRFCSWCMKSIKENDETRSKNGHSMHKHCFIENIERNNRMIKHTVEDNKIIKP